jgi:hypothetical protein
MVEKSKSQLAKPTYEFKIQQQGVLERILRIKSTRATSQLEISL